MSLATKECTSNLLGSGKKHTFLGSAEANLKVSKVEIKKTILLIDDDKSLNYVAKIALEKIGYTVYVAANGEEALGLFSIHEASAILLDLSMPQVNGFEICRLIRMSEKGIKVPILIMTGHTESEYVERAYQAGATDFIRKPVNWTVLKHRLELYSKISSMDSK
jgi:DNA-binding response OmpR family regulator